MVKNNVNINYFDISNKVFILTGAAGQLGKTIVSNLLSLKSKIIAVDININELKKIKANNKDKNLLIMQCDITKKKQLEKVISNSHKIFGKIDGIIANAGVSVFENFLDRSEKSIDYVMDVNIKGTILSNQTYINYKKRKKSGGVILNISSHYGLISPDPRIYTTKDRRNSEVYGASKAGVIQMTKYYATHAAKYGIRVNCISPGGINSNSSNQSIFFKKNYNFRCPMNRLAEDYEIIGSIIYLLSDASSYVNGHNLIIDGGMSSW